MFVEWAIELVIPDNIESVNRNVVTKVSHNQYINILLNKKYFLRRWVNRIESENSNIRIYEINKIYFPSFDDEIFILDNGIDV